MSKRAHARAVTVILILHTMVQSSYKVHARITKTNFSLRKPQCVLSPAQFIQIRHKMWPIYEQRTKKNNLTGPPACERFQPFNKAQHTRDKTSCCLLDPRLFTFIISVGYNFSKKEDLNRRLAHCHTH